MMPRWEAVIFLLCAGSGLLIYVRYAYKSGVVRAGSNYLSVNRLSREDNPVSYRFFLTMYFCGGVALCVWGLLAMLGMAPSIRW